MAVQTSAVIWPYAYKTVAISCATTSLTMPLYVASSTAGGMPAKRAMMGLEIFPPLYVYDPTQMFMHLNYTFNAGLQTADMTLLGVAMTDTISPFIEVGGSSVQTYMALNVEANGSRNISLSLDVSSILTGLPTNVLWLVFNTNCAQQYRPSGVYGDTINLWKLDLYYQTIGIRDEQ